MRLSDTAFERAKRAEDHLYEATRSIRILKSLVWSEEVRETFLKTDRLPNIEYPDMDVSDCLEHVAQGLALADGDHVVFAWLRRLGQSIETTAHMLRARGTPEFFEHSQSLYGVPTETLMDRKTRVLDMAHHMDHALDDLVFDKLVIEGYEVEMDAEAFAVQLRDRLEPHFGDAMPDVQIVDQLSAKAVAGSTRIRLRKEAVFSNRDIEQLLQHEALIHTATALNGKSQPNFPILGRAHAYTTEIQEGLAVFAEMISGAMDPRRFQRLVDRVLAIQMAIEGANFNEVFDFYMERHCDRVQAFENARRVFRGGVTNGGAPFTKDMVYLNGLLRVHNFMRSVVKLKRADLIRILFVGKLDIEDVPALAQLAESGRITPPKYMPPWIKDLRFLVSYLGYSSFLNQVKMPGFQAYYEDLISEIPDVWAFVE